MSNFLFPIKDMMKLVEMLQNIANAVNLNNLISSSRKSGLSLMLVVDVPAFMR
jgi:hypothetical protein